MDQLRSLRVFAQVIAQGSFAAAARSLDIAPAVVTRAVADLEAHLGARLLHRTTRKLALTKIGEMYLARVRSMLADLDDADALAGSASTQARGKLRVLCPPAFAVHQLAQHLPRFRARHPHIGLDLSTPGPVDMADENFDVSILSIGQQSMQGDFVVRKLATSSFVLCASPAYLEHRHRPEHPDDLLTHEGILPAVAAVRHGLTLYRHTSERPNAASDTVTVTIPPCALTTNHIDTMLAAAVSGLGIAGLPSFVAARALRDGRLERVLPDWRGVTLTLYAAMPTRKHVPARTRLFIDFLVQTFGGTGDDPWLALGDKAQQKINLL